MPVQARSLLPASLAWPGLLCAGLVGPAVTAEGQHFGNLLLSLSAPGRKKVPVPTCRLAPSGLFSVPLVATEAPLDLPCRLLRKQPV